MTTRRGWAGEPGARSATSSNSTVVPGIRTVMVSGGAARSWANAEAATVRAMLHARSLRLVMIALILCTGGCASNRTDRAHRGEATAFRFEFARVVMGSRARIVLYAPSEAVAVDAARQAFDEMDRLNLVLSDYTPASEAMRLCAAPIGTPHPVSADLLDVVLKAARVHESSGGAFDPTLGALTGLWRESFRSERLPDPQRLAGARERSGLHLIRVDETRSTIELLAPGVRLDFGAIGKGYAAGAALQVLSRLGMRRAMVDLGGDLALGDAPPGAKGWRIEATDDRGGAREFLLANVGVATSGDKYRSVTIDGVQYSHILDPRTGVGLRSSRAVTVIASQAWLADALASAASVLGPEGEGGLSKIWPGAELVWHAGQAG
eukprot:g5857.t1